MTYAYICSELNNVTESNILVLSSHMVKGEGERERESVCVLPILLTYQFKGEREVYLFHGPVSSKVAITNMTPCKRKHSLAEIKGI